MLRGTFIKQSKFPLCILSSSSLIFSYGRVCYLAVETPGSAANNFPISLANVLIFVRFELNISLHNRIMSSHFSVVSLIVIETVHKMKPKKIVLLQGVNTYFD